MFSKLYVDDRRTKTLHCHHFFYVLYFIHKVVYRQWKSNQTIGAILCNVGRYDAFVMNRDVALGCLYTAMSIDPVNILVIIESENGNFPYVSGSHVNLIDS